MDQMDRLEGGFSSSLEPKIWGIYRGLTILFERGFNKILIESDSQEAVQLISDGGAHNHPQSTIINEANLLLGRTGSSLIYMGRDANQCTDHLAHMGAEQEEELVVIFNPPTSIREFLHRDKLGIQDILD